MRLPRIRFTVRRIMLIVAITAVALGANDLRLRYQRYRALSSVHEWTGRSCSTMAERHAATAAGNEREAERLRAAIRSDRESKHPQVVQGILQIAANTAAQAEVERAAERKFRARAQFHEALRVKYERAARRPWILVEPDPPEPE
jgi:hypothetical protein